MSRGLGYPWCKDSPGSEEYLLFIFPICFHPSSEQDDDDRNDAKYDGKIHLFFMNIIKKPPTRRLFKTSIVFLFLSGILSPVAEMHSIFETVSFLATKTIHCTPETDCRSCLIFFQVPSGSWA